MCVETLTLPVAVQLSHYCHGLLVGAVIGAWLARSWQHKSQLLESKRPKYRELRREDWEKLQYVLVKMARQNRVIPNDIIGPTLIE